MGDVPNIPDVDSAIGRLIGGKFRVADRLGSGTTAAVYRARHEELGKMVALKLLREKRCPPAYAKRFQREARAACRLDHQNCVRILDFGRDEDVLYLAMEYIEGETLDALIEREAPMPLSRICELMCQVLAGLSAAHELNVVHRDVKPANVLVTRQSDDDDRSFDCAKVCDFGMAKIFTPDGEEHEHLTEYGALIGTPSYMAPEQAAGDPVDERADVFSSGIILYQMATGHLPFESASITGLLVKLLREPPIPPTKWVKNLDPELVRIIGWAMEKDPSKRCRSAKLMRRALAKLGSAELTEVSESEFGPTVLLTEFPLLAKTIPTKAAGKDIPDAITEPMGGSKDDETTVDAGDDDVDGVGTQSQPILLLPKHRKKN